MAPRTGQHKKPMKEGKTILPQSERVKQMIENYISLHDQGLTPKQIAHKYDLASGTVYQHLQEIADAAGVTRESLLQIPHAPHTPSERRFDPVQPVDLTDFHTHFQQADEEMTHLIEASATAISTNEEIAKKVEEEENEWQSNR